MAITEIRDPSHAGTWYSADRKELSSQLDGWLDQVKTPIEPIASDSAGSIGTLPVPGARVIIAPHAGYAYSGPAAAWAYKSWEVTGVERVFLLGPSHHHYLEKCALSKLDEYATPLGNLIIDKETTTQLYQTGQFEYMSQSVDEAEHSLEMHLPYIYKILSQTFPSPDQHPKLVPIMVGNTSPTTETAIGRILSAYLSDPKSAFVISSDFAHWGDRFRYTYYVPDPNDPASAVRSYGSYAASKKRRIGELSAPGNRSAASGQANGVAIHESIKAVDFECIRACETGRHGAWTDVLARTGNTVCGRHPVGCVLAGIEQMDAALGEEKREAAEEKNKEESSAGDAEANGNLPKGRFVFVRYDRSSLVNSPRDSSVSYASAFAVL